MIEVGEKMKHRGRVESTAFIKRNIVLSLMPLFKHQQDRDQKWVNSIQCKGKKSRPLSRLSRLFVLICPPAAHGSF